MTSPAMDYLGCAIEELLRIQPFSGWRVTRTVENDPKLEIWYEFDGRGIEVVCDETDRVKTIFLHRGDGECLIDVPFALDREQVLDRFGTPEKSGRAVRIAGLGDRGSWDRFTLPGGTLHIQYAIERDEIDMITLIRTGMEP